MRYQDDNGPPLFTFAMLAVYIAFFGAEYTAANLTPFYAFPWRVADGELWRLLTSTFLHGSILHFLFNLYWFFRFADVIDNWLGPWGALLLYAAYGLSSSAAQILVGAGPHGAIGASGVVYGLFGFLWVMGRRRDDAFRSAGGQTAQFMLGWVVICAVLNAFGGHIANTAHVWGLLLGWLTGQVFVARKNLRIPLIAAMIIAWALPIALVQRPVWERTLGRMPQLNRDTWLNPPQDYRDHFERNAERYPPGFL
jgi:membrane associated rhomboid family serine protease